VALLTLALVVVMSRSICREKMVDEKPGDVNTRNCNLDYLIPQGFSILYRFCSEFEACYHVRIFILF
jgi:hypothetical protein